MNLFRAVVTCILVLSAAYELSARTSLYLYPRIDSKACLTVGDIATIEGEAGEVDEVAAIQFNEEASRDGYLDAGEILRAVRAQGQDCFIYGSAVRVFKNDGVREEEFPSDMNMPSPAVKKGHHVTIVARRGAIRIEVAGTALSDAMTGENVAVRTRNRGILQCRVLDEKTVEVDI